MATKLEDALRKVTALPGVKAAFVFDQFQTIVARDVPGQYSNDILKRIASQLYQLALFSWKTKVLTQEFRLIYEKYAVYTRLFAKNFYLVVFMEKNLEPGDFRQPLNLSLSSFWIGPSAAKEVFESKPSHGQGGPIGGKLAEGIA